SNNPPPAAKKMTGDGKTLLHFHILYSLLFLTLSCSAVNQLNRGESLIDGQTLISADDRFELGFFSPGTSTSRYLAIWYHDAQENDSVIWVANRDRPIPDRTGLLTFAADGNLIVTSGNGTNSPPIWSSNSTIVESNDTVAVLTATGNLILSRNETIGDVDRAFWQSFQNPTDTYLPNMRVLVDASAGENHAFRSWRSPNDPSFGNFTLGVDPRGAPQIVIWDELGERRWRSGQWNGLIFTGVPSMTTLTNFQYGFKLTREEDGRLYFTYNPSNSTALLRFRIRYDGMEEQLRWNEVSRNWDVMQRQPEDECERYNTCGEFGVCNESARPKCGCMEGFRPRDLGEWNRGNFSGGCVRNTPLECRRINGTETETETGGDGFRSMRCAKLPDFADVTTGVSSENCREICLEDCDCSAYSAINGIGCMIWRGGLIDVQHFSGAGNMLNLKLSGSDLDEGKKLSTPVIIGIVLGSVVCFAIAVWLICRIKRKLKVLPAAKASVSGPVQSDSPLFDPTKSREYSTDLSGPAELIEAGQMNHADLPMMNINIVALATNHFSAENKLGQGGFGPVYKGTLPGGEEIAVKRLSKISGQGLEEFKNEISLIAKLQHRNLVRLLGYCVQGEEKMLIYEYMPNKSLDFFLFDSTKQASLDWGKRFAIIEGIARGLLYLHRDSRLRIIHRDLKASNILLDEEMNPKISDFGMARIFGGNQNEANTNRVVGTYGYMSPEYAMEGLFSVKSDVYSFGVLVLEIVSGRRNTSFRSTDHVNLISYAWDLWTEGRALELVDSSIRQSCKDEELVRCIHLGMICVQDNPTLRPTMAAVMLILESESPSLPMPRQPTFTSSMRASVDRDLIFHTTSKITSLARSGFLSQARKLFDEMPSRDTVAWNSMLTSYSQLGFHREALSLFHNHMRLSGSKPDGFTFTATLNACAGLGSFRSGTKLHALVIVLGCQTLLPVNNSLVDMYGKCFDPVSAGNVFKEMSFANEVSWCSLLFAYTNSGLFCEADEVFRLMPKKIDVAWNIMISGFGQCGEIELCVDFVRRMRLSSCFPDQFTYSTIINACAECLESGFGFMIHGIAIRSGWSSAMEVKNSIFNLYAKLGSITEAEKVFQFQFESSGMLTQVSWNSIIDAYMKSGDTDKAFLAFQQMPEKNLVSWTSMIAGYAQKGLGEEALNLFSYMIRDGLLPDDFTLGAALHACSTLASINHGRMIHGCVVQSGFSTYDYIGNGLVNMYAKCGDLDSSMMAFHICRKSIVSLNTMIFSLGLHGRGNQALQLYEDMIESGIKPDKVTFIGLLMTCSHSGMVEKGRMLFDSMSSDHGVPHEADHVACMVDLLSRAGYSSEAKELAGKYQDSRHGELKLSQPSYVLQSNMYSASGEWERAELVRKAMADEGLKKPPGCSWIEVRNEVACFVAVDSSSSSSSSSTLIRTEELFQSALSEGCSSVRSLIHFSNEVFELGFFAPDRNRSRNLYLGIRFKQTSPQTIVWVANREAPVTEESARLLVNGDGNLELQDGRRRRIWGTNFTASSNSTGAILQNDGNFALITGSGGRLWQSGDNSGDTLIEGKWLMFNQSNPTARPFRLNSWKSAGDPSPGSFTVGFLLQSPPQATISKDGNPYWRSGPWDRARFINIPDMDTDYQSSLTLIEDQGLVYLSLIPPRNCTYTTFQMTWTGSLQLRCWDRIRGWYTRFETPKSECEVYGACGENGVCGRDDPLKCDCIRGFMPKSEEEWNVGNWSRGCVRRTASVCSRNASSNGAGDGFLKMSGVNVPEVYEFMRVWDGSEGWSLLGGISMFEFLVAI
ncbi:G-type lectin S-receptor-like serine/threonine-protein kinase B120, partial [Linum perenne]